MTQKFCLARPCPVAAAAILGIAAFTNDASAVVLLQDNFDSYADQAAFLAAWPATVGTGNTLSNALSLSAPNSINLPITAQRNDRSFAESGNPAALNVIRFSIDFFDPNSAAAPYRQVATLIDGAGSSSGQLISLGMNNNQAVGDSGGNFYMARILGYTAVTVDPEGGPNEAAGGTTVANSFFKLNDYGVGFRSTGWHNLAVEITNVEFKFFVDGVLAETVANAATLRSYDSVRLGSGITAATSANLDNVAVETNPVPEPGTLAFGLLGGLVLLRRRRCE